MISNYNDSRCLSVVIPVFNNEGSIAKTHSKITEVLKRDLPDITYRIIFVNDGSTDNSLLELNDLKGVEIVKLTRNFGQESAILAGYSKVNKGPVITMSADLQDPPELITAMYRSYSAGSDVVICHREARAEGFTKKIFPKIAYFFLKKANSEFPKGGFDFFLMSQRALETFKKIEVRNRFFQGDVLWAGYPTAFIPYVRLDRMVGRSQYTFSKKLKIFLDSAFSTSFFPIRVISVVGLTIAFSGFVYAAAIILNKFFGNTPFRGWSPIMLSIMIIGGLNILMLGVVGEYVWRIYDEVKRRPSYVIDE